MNRYKFKIEGIDANNNTWTTTGTVTGDFMECLTEACRQSFLCLTQGKAVFGSPGVGCRGPYKITNYELKALSTKSYIGVAQGLRGWFAVHMSWNNEFDGFEPFVTSPTSHATKEKAVEEAHAWAISEEVEYKD